MLDAKGIEYVPGVGVDVAYFSSVRIDRMAMLGDLGLPSDSVILLSVGELNINKNHEVVLNALAKLQNPNLQYIICGVGRLEDRLKQLSLDLGIGDQVKFLGFRYDIAEICALADLFIMPSRREGLPVALMEAMASGLPVVCSDVRGNRDLIQHGFGGYLVDPTDVDGFATAIDSLVQNKERRLSMGLNNKTIIQNYDVSNVMAKMSRIYSKYGCLR